MIVIKNGMKQKCMGEHFNDHASEFPRQMLKKTGVISLMVLVKLNEGLNDLEDCQRNG